MLTLKILRSTILKLYQKGVDKSDRKTGDAFWDELIFQARAMLIETNAKTGVDPEWLQTISIPITRQTDPAGNYYWESTSNLPDIIMVDNNLGIYTIRNTAGAKETISVFENQSSAKGKLAKYDRITGKRTKVFRVGPKLRIITEVKLTKTIEADVLLYHPSQDGSWTEDSLFPFSETKIGDLKEIIQRDLLKLTMGEEGKNDSQEEFIVPPKQARPQ